MFVQTEARRTTVKQSSEQNNAALTSEILTIKNGFGFIKYPPNNLFFHYTSVIDTDFNDLQVGDKVQFTLDKNDKGDDIAKNVKLL